MHRFHAQHPLILVIDDEDLIRSLCRSILERNGFRVLCAEDGEKGVTFYRDNAAKINLVLCDLSMSKLDGLRTIEKMRSLSPAVRVILMSGYDIEEVVPADLRNTSILLKKPFTKDQLLRAVEESLTLTFASGVAL